MLGQIKQPPHGGWDKITQIYFLSPLLQASDEEQSGIQTPTPRTHLVTLSTLFTSGAAAPDSDLKLTRVSGQH
jgi:hypothetical protein